MVNCKARLGRCGHGHMQLEVETSSCSVISFLEYIRSFYTLVNHRIEKFLEIPCYIIEEPDFPVFLCTTLKLLQPPHENTSQLRKEKTQATDANHARFKAGVYSERDLDLLAGSPGVVSSHPCI